MKIKKIRKIKIDNVYDLEIEENHNFFANNILVHNCIRGIMKKLGKAEKSEKDLNEWKKTIDKFKRGCLKNGIKGKEAEKIAEDIVAFSSYSFNRCFSGDCVINRDNRTRWSPTIEEMYLTKNDKKWAEENGHIHLHGKYNYFGYGKAFSLNEDGRIYINEIVDIYKREKQEVFLITTESGKKIKVSKNHKFPVGETKEEKSINTGLVIGDFLYIKLAYEKSNINYSFSGVKEEDRIFKEYEGEGFKEGKKNSAYINGEFLKFKNRRKELLEASNGICFECGKKNNRLECHHKDGNRKNNEDDNLILVCPSCHKKMDYFIGRNVKNSKGFPSKLDKIISIESVGIEQTYDVEMKDPYHTVCVNDIVAKNSHAACYTYVSIMTLYLSVYFRKYFYTAGLTYEIEKDTDLFEKINAVRGQGFKILPPDVNKSKEHMVPLDDNSILFGLADIKGVGEKAVSKIMECKPFDSTIDFILKTRSREVTSAVIKALVMSGALDQFEKNRKKNLMVVERFWETKKTTKIQEKLLSIWGEAEKNINYLPGIKTSNEDLIEYEKKCFGFNFFTSYFEQDIIDAFIKMEKMGLIYKSFLDIDYGSRKVPVYINSLRTIRDKNDREMVFADMEDIYGTKKSIPIFSSYWKYLKDRIAASSKYLLNLYMTEDGGILFGKKQFSVSETDIIRMVKDIPS